MALKFHPKMTAGVFAGAAATMIISEANRRGFPIDGTEGAALTVMLAGLAGYFMPSDDPAPPPPPIAPPLQPPAA